MEEIAVIILGYLAGSLPFTFLLARWYGVDLRYEGSGNVGAANMLRTRGAMSAVLAVAADGAKGAVAVLVAMWVTSGSVTPVAAGLASIIGHVYPVWLGFRGGKGVATAAGVFLVIEPIAVAIAGGVFVVGVLSSRYVSIGSIAAAITLASAVVVLGAPSVVVAGAVVAAAIVVHRHRGNLSRLLAGTERRVMERS